ncbi:hypothetical protein SAMN06297251_113106 [Fulvimarina manganoxydans]|uniref:Uncharacterized protein n=1 Tax=Fulvimarina manganoxydans TaxID=937218 RepID=A0A1W2DAS5_9HYPH|nr:hypothetical protein SAMN06297251_113106 [Fulvimarina manganoxydans]
MDASASPHGEEAVGACSRLLRQLPEVIVTTTVGRNPLRFKLVTGVCESSQAATAGFSARKAPIRSIAR